MSSVDYQTFNLAEAEERSRLAKVYQGAETDSAPAVEHLSIEHLDRLLSSSIPIELRALYLQEYDDMRAATRAIAMCNLTRKDYYDYASQQALNDVALLSISLASNTVISQQLLKTAPESVQTFLQDLESEYTAKKNEVVDRLKNLSGLFSEDRLSDSDFVRISMKDTDNTTPRGTSTSVKTD